MTEHLEHKHRNGLTRWAVTIFMSGLVSGFGLLLVWDRGRIAGDAENALKKATALETAAAVTVVELKGIKNRLSQIEETQHQILEAVR